MSKFLTCSEVRDTQVMLLERRVERRRGAECTMSVFSVNLKVTSYTVFKVKGPLISCYIFINCVRMKTIFDNLLLKETKLARHTRRCVYLTM